MDSIDAAVAEVLERARLTIEAEIRAAYTRGYIDGLEVCARAAVVNAEERRPKRRLRRAA